MRKKGDGAFRKLTNGTIEYIVSLENDIYGVRQRKRFYGKTEAKCHKKYKEFLEGGSVKQVASSEHTLSSWFDEWLTYQKAKVQSGTLQSSTCDEYVHLVNRVRKYPISKMKLSQVKTLHVTDFFASIIGYSHSVRKKTRFVLNDAFEYAIDNDYCTKNPVRRAIIAKKIEPEKDFFSKDEVRTILAFAKDDELFGVAIYILLNSGVRGQELRALTTDKVDYDRGIITIDQAVKETGELGKPKNGKPRIVPLEAEAVAFLKAKLHAKSGYVVGGADFVTKNGFRGRYDCFFGRLNKYLDNVGEAPIKGKSAHKTRHSFTTLRQDSGMPKSKVSAIVGHGAKDITDNYTHFGDATILTEAVKTHSFLSWLGVT
jgi:integrase